MRSWSHGIDIDGYGSRPAAFAKASAPLVQNPGEALAETGRRDDSELIQFSNSRAHSRGSFSPEFCHLVVPLSQRAQGKPGADCARSPVCEECYRNAHGLNYRYSRDIPAFPAQWFYGLYVISPGKRPFLPPLPAETIHRRSARVAAPGPHDFAVRGFPSSGERASISFEIKPLRLRSPRPSPPEPNVP
jgi:hypothetical protein